MDKSWMTRLRSDNEYVNGVKNFIQFAFENASNRDRIKCPCKKCCNCEWKTHNEVLEHLLFKGILPTYTVWTHHGEKLNFQAETSSHRGQESSTSRSSNMHHLVQDAVGIHSVNMQVPYENFYGHDANADEIMLEDNISIADPEELFEDVDNEMLDSDTSIADSDEELMNEDETILGDETSTAAPEEKFSEFQKFVEDANEFLYPGSDTSPLSFVVHLLHIKIKNNWSDKSVDELLQLLNVVFPQAKLPSSFYEAKKTIKALGLYYDKIDACPNNCMLYWRERANLETCYNCNASRWKISESENSKKVPAKVLRYFPLIPRLQRLYMSSKTSSLMRWHDEHRQNDGLMRHPADSQAWKSFNERYSDFAVDCRNVRLGLGGDGFNPFGTLSNSYSIWPIILMPYNLPPWLCMKQEHLILSMIIPGEKGPGTNIDVYLQPLIAELLELWEGVKTYDASSKQHFIMRAALMWTINDFPAYAYLSGWSTSGKTACPCCADNTTSRWLRNGRKYCYLGHRRWLSSTHKYRKQKHLFDGTEEHGRPPIPMSGTTALRQLQGVNFIFEGQDMKGHMWKKKSIFFKLPYWEGQILRHNLDVMHIEKNICERLVGTLLNNGEKKKQDVTSRDDLALMGIRHNMHPKTKPDGRKVIPHACYHLSRAETDTFLQLLEDAKFPDGYVSNISRGVNKKERKIQSLKSHDYHILMQDLLPIALRSCMTSKVVKVITDLSAIFKGVCSKIVQYGQ